MNPIVTSSEDITLVTLHNCPSSIVFGAKIFSSIAEQGVNVDMISQAPSHGDLSDLSFTIDDEDMGKILAIISELKNQTDIKPIISNGNCKINVYDDHMKATPGVAAKVFTAAASLNTDIRVITTSDVDISILVTQADFQQTLAAIEQALKK